MKKVSVVVPVYNAEETIEKCIQSLRVQIYTELEIILIDDGSRDNSLIICEKYRSLDSRIKVIHHNNHGVSYTRNCGIDMATGDYLMFVDSDDEIKPDCIQTYVNAMESSQADVVIGGITMVYVHGEVLDKLPENPGVFGQEIWNLISCDSSGLFGYAPNKLYDLGQIKKSKLHFNTELFAQEDLDFALSVYNISRKFCMISYSGYLYYYMEARNNHPYIHYIMNKVKLYEYGKRKGVLNETSKYVIIGDIENLLYVAMYYYSGTNFRNYCNELRNIKNLVDILKEKENLKFTTKCLLLHKDSSLQIYFGIRKQISYLLHRM